MPEFVIGACHQLWRIEKTFRMSKHDLRARPICHHKRESNTLTAEDPLPPDLRDALAQIN